MSDEIEETEHTPDEKPDHSYQEARGVLEGQNHKNLIKLASDKHSYPEMLYFLSENDEPEIRNLVAANPSTPAQADEILSKDKEPSVRQALGAKIACRFSSSSSSEENGHAAGIAILEHLIADEEVRVRRVIAEELKAMDNVPLHIIQKLARDVDEHVHTPILNFSPVLEDEDLIAIIEDTATTSQLKAIADRRVVSEPLAECIIETADVQAITHLLLNTNAQIRENTLDQLIGDARDVPEWHEPLVLRPLLPSAAIRKIADFVAGSLLETLSKRNDLDDDLRADLEYRVLKRLAIDDCPHDDATPQELEKLESELRNLHAMGELNEGHIGEFLDKNDRNAMIVSLAILADLSVFVSRRIFVSQSPKALMSLGWKAGLSAAVSTKIQSTVARLPANDWILPNDEGEYPFTESEMQWQLALFVDQEDVLASQDQENLAMSAS